MNIQKAVLVANSKGKYIYRKSENELNILPTNTLDCCVLILENSDKVGKRWNPNANDLIADDWNVR